MTESASAMVLQLQHLSGHYGETQALHDISIEVREGEIVCLLGRNGAGKTSLFKVLGGAAEPKAGTITL